MGSLALVVFAGCSATQSADFDKAPKTTTSAAVSTTSASSVATTAASVDMNALVAPYANGYQFTTTLNVGGKVTATFVGRRFGGATVILDTEGGLTIDEIITPTAVWVRQKGQDWQEVTAPNSTGDPLQPLRSPTSVSVQADGTVAATYPAVAFGLPPGDLPVVITTAGGVLSKVRYDTVVGGKPASLETVFSALTDTTPITAPA